MPGSPLRRNVPAPIRVRRWSVSIYSSRRVRIDIPQPEIVQNPFHGEWHSLWAEQLGRPLTVVDRSSYQDFSYRTDLAQILKPEPEKHNLRHQITAFVKGGGSNLKTCTEIVREVTDCQAMGLDMCFNGICFSHIVSGACNTPLRRTVDSQFDQTSSSRAISELQDCIRWNKKSGNEAWFASCIARGKWRRKMPTLVKTRLASSIVMMCMMLLCRDVVEHCFQIKNQSPCVKWSRVTTHGKLLGLLWG